MTRTTHLLLACICLSGCAGISPSVPERLTFKVSPTETTALRVTDARSPHLKTSVQLPVSAGTMFIYADDKMTPEPINVVRSVLLESTGMAMVGRKIELERFVAYATLFKKVDRLGWLVPPLGSPQAVFFSVLFGELRADAVQRANVAPGQFDTLTTEVALRIDGDLETLTTRSAIHRSLSDVEVSEQLVDTLRRLARRLNLAPAQ